MAASSNARFRQAGQTKKSKKGLSGCVSGRWGQLIKTGRCHQKRSLSHCLVKPGLFISLPFFGVPKRYCRKWVRIGPTWFCFDRHILCQAFCCISLPNPLVLVLKFRVSSFIFLPDSMNMTSTLPAGRTWIPSLLWTFCLTEVGSSPTKIGTQQRGAAAAPEGQMPSMGRVHAERAPRCGAYSTSLALMKQIFDIYSMENIRSLK